MRASLLRRFDILLGVSLGLVASLGSTIVSNPLIFIVVAGIATQLMILPVIRAEAEVRDKAALCICAVIWIAPIWSAELPLVAILWTVKVAALICFLKGFTSMWRRRA